MRIKRVEYYQNAPIGGDFITRAHHELDQRAPKETDLLGAIYLDEGKALDYCDYCNRNLSQKEWEIQRPAGIKNEYHVEIRKFYIETQLLWD